MRISAFPVWVGWNFIEWLRRVKRRRFAEESILGNVFTVIWWSLSLQLYQRLRQKRAARIDTRVKSRAGVWIYIDPSDQRGRSLIEAGGNLNRTALAIWHRLLASQQWTHIVDVGANYGEMLVNGGLPSGARVIAVEPNPQVRRYLARTLAGSGATVDLIDLALSDCDGEASLCVTAGWSGTTHLAPAGPGTVPVRTTTLSSILRSEAMPAAEMRLLLKIDVEGHELAVLRGALEILPDLREFCALVEISSMTEADILWVTENFSVSLYDRCFKTLRDTVAHRVREALGSADIHDKDIILRRLR